jgi:hypothetical protein
MMDRLAEVRESHREPRNRAQVELHGTATAPGITREFVFRRSDELSSHEREQFRALFGRVFGKDLSDKQFVSKYVSTPLGFSHHGLMAAGGQIVGAYNLVPYRYEYFGTQQVFGLSVDAMVDPLHRSGPFHLVKMARLVYEAARRDGVVFAFGFPNDQAYAFTRRILKWRCMGDLDFYALPLRIGRIRPSLAWADRISRFCSAGFIHVPRLSLTRAHRAPVQKVCDEAFRQHRYDERHGRFPLKHGGECTYRVYEEDGGVRALYIIDVEPLTAAHFGEAARRAYAIAASNADLMLYVGRLPFRPPGLIRVPRSRRPRCIRMCGKILDANVVDDRVFQIENWSVNISNFDVR